MFFKPAYLDALSRWGQIADNEGVSKALLAYRWISYHSALKPDYGDTLILGASRPEQIAESVAGLKEGPLRSESAKAIDEIWGLVENDAPTGH